MHFALRLAVFSWIASSKLPGLCRQASMLEAALDAAESLRFEVSFLQFIACL
jgi:hypothetical protein